MRVAQLGLPGELDELLDQPLALVVGRMRLAGDHELHRTLGG